jgi:hypothetical protein
MMQSSPLLQILDLARWAPSGDNTQPWRFEIIDDRRFLIHAHDEGHDRAYNLDGRPLQLALGAVIENAAIAATAHGLRVRWQIRTVAPLIIDVSLEVDAAVIRNPLIDAIVLRSVQRRPLSTRALRLDELQALEASVTPGYRLHWLAGSALRRRTARLLFDSALIRLTMPEAFEVHRHAIQWGVRYSIDRVPSQALGVDRLTALMMRWAMHSWPRIEFLNRFAGGTLMPRVLMDWIPGLRCAAHVAILADEVPQTVEDQLQAGQAMQRFWLTATRLGLQHQPEMTPLIFSRYAREGRRFSEREALLTQAADIGRRFDALLDQGSIRAVWFGRIGAGMRSAARSERLSLTELLIPAIPVAHNAR